MIRIRFAGKYDLMYFQLLKNSPNVKEEILKRISWFTKNPKDARLGNHPLTGKLKGKWAFGITDDIRIVYEWRGKSVARFLAIGGHKKVYAQR